MSTEPRHVEWPKPEHDDQFVRYLVARSTPQGGWEPIAYIDDEDANAFDDIEYTGDPTYRVIGVYLQGTVPRHVEVEDVTW